MMGEIDVIFHMAALARIQPSIKNPVRCLENNFNGTLNILEYARKHQIPVVYAGSSSKHHGLYGSPYAWSKYGGEELCKLYSEVYDVPTAVQELITSLTDNVLIIMLLIGIFYIIIGTFMERHRT